MPSTPKKTSSKKTTSSADDTDTPEDLPAPPQADDTSVQDQDVAGSLFPGVETVEMEFRGQKFFFPKDRDEWPTTAIVAFSEFRLAIGVREVLGPKQWQLINTILPRFRDFQELFVPVFGKAQQQCTGGSA